MEEAVVQEGKIIRINCSPVGVHLPPQRGLDAIIGRRARIGGDFSLRASSCKKLDLDGINIDGTGYFNGMGTMTEEGREDKEANKPNLVIQEAYLTGIQMESGSFYGMQAQYIFLTNGLVERDIDFRRAHFGRVGMAGLTVGGILLLEDAVIQSCDDATGLVVGAYSLNSATRIPETLKKALSRYPEKTKYVH